MIDKTGKSFVNAASSGVRTGTTSFSSAASKVVDFVNQKFNTGNYSWTGKTPQQMSTLEKAAYLRQNSTKTGAREAFSALADEMRSTASRHYSPYLTGTSNQQEAMDFFGRNSFDQDWLDSNRFLLNYTSQLDWTDTISTSGQAKWSDAQKAGYYWQMLNEAEKTTQAAESEWTALRADMQQNFNEYKRLYGKAPDYDTLMSFINMSNYGTLQKMDKVYDNVEDLVRLNRSVAYSPETLIGVYGALLEGKDVTEELNYLDEAIRYTMKPIENKATDAARPNYSGWTQQQIDAKRNNIRKNGTRAELAQFEADLYASTPRLDSVDSESYFSQTYYDQAFLDKYAYMDAYVEQLRNRNGDVEKPTSSDPWWYHAAYEYNQIKQQEEDTKAAEEEWKKLRAMLARDYDPETSTEDAFASIDWDKYPTLKKLREGKDVNLNRPVYFSDEAVMGVLKALSDGSATDNDDLDYALYQTPVATSKGTDNARKENYDSIPTQEINSGYVQRLVDEVGYEEAAAIVRNYIVHLRTVGHPEEIAELESQLAEIAPAETDGAENDVVAERISFMDNLWSDVTAKDTSNAAAVEKAFYEQHGRPMNAVEREQAGLPPFPLEAYPGGVPELGQMTPEKQSIFTDEMNAAASKIINPKTGEGYANMDELLANDPAVLSDMLNYIEATPKQTAFTTKDVRAFREIQQYQEDVGNQGMDVLFRTYADDNAVDADRLYASLQYIVESGLTLEEKSRLGLLDDSLTGGERLERAAELSQELFVERGSEFTRAMAIAILPKDAPEGWVNLVDAGLSNLFAVETGIVGGLMRTQALLPSVARDVWSAAMMPIYTNKLGTDYTLDEACEIDPILRGLTAAKDQIGTVVDVASPDMSNYGYGASVTRFITEAAVNQKVMNTLAPGARSFVDSTLKRMGLGNLGNVLAGGGGIGRFFSRALDATKGALPWMLRSMSESAEEARELGASETDALRYGIYSAGTTGMVEGWLGQMYDGLTTKGGNLISSTLSKAFKGGWKKFVQSKGVVYATNLIQQGFGESLEELAEMPLDKLGRSSILGIDSPITTGDWSEAWDSAKLSFASSVFTSLFFGFTAEQDAKIYSDSEKLADRIAHGDVTMEELMEYAMVYETMQGNTSEDLNEIMAKSRLLKTGLLTDEEINAEEPTKTYNFPMIIPGETRRDSGYFGVESSAGTPRLDRVMSATPTWMNGNYLLRDTMRIIEQNQAAMDEAAIDTAAEEAVQQQIADGAMDDITGEASAGMQAIRAIEADIALIQQQIDGYDAEIAELDRQKRAALYAAASNGLPTDKGSVRQLIHNLDESMASIYRRREVVVEKLTKIESDLTLKKEQIASEVRKRESELRKAASVQERQKLDDARNKADEVIADSVAEAENVVRTYTYTGNSEKAKGFEGEKNIPVMRKHATFSADIKRILEPNSYIGDSRSQFGDTAMYSDVWGDDDAYGPESGKAQEDKANASHDRWSQFDEADDDSSESEGNYAEIPKSLYDQYEQKIQMLADDGVYISDEHLRTRHEANDQNDPIQQMTDGEYSTVAASKDGRYLVVVNAGSWNAYNERKSEYEQNSQQYTAAGREIAKVQDERERQTESAKLFALRQSNKKPASPKGTYLIIDKQRSWALEGMSLDRIDVNGLVGMIDARIAELESGEVGDVERVAERVHALRQLKTMASNGQNRRFLQKLQLLSARRDQSKPAVQEAARLMEAFGADGDAVETYTQKAAAKRLNNLVVAKANNKNQAIDTLKKFAGADGYETFNRNATYYATDALMEALDTLDRYISDDGAIDIDAFVQANPEVFYAAKDKSAQDYPSLEDRLARAYTSPLAEGNDKYVAIDSADGINLVVAKKDTRIDPAQTGDVRVNPDVHSVADATEALQRVLDEVYDQMRGQAALYAPKPKEGEKTPAPKLSANQRRFYAGMVIYSVRGEDGELVNLAITKYTDPETGKKRWPSAADLLKVAERITVNYTHYDVYYPTTVEYKSKKTGKTEKRTRMDPVRNFGQDQYRFTLEKSTLAPEYSVIQASSVPDQSRFESELQRAEADYDAYMGKKADPKLKTQYFINVCEANYQHHVKMVAVAAQRADAANASDQELESLQQRAMEHREAATTWLYLKDQMTAALRDETPGSVSAVLKEYEKLLKESGNASMDARMKIAASLRKSMQTVRQNQLKAAIPEDATIQTLQAEYDEAGKALQDVMAARNHAAVLAYGTPASTNNEPLAQALEARRDQLEQQIEIMNGDQETPAPEGQPEEAMPEEVQAPQEERVETPSGASDEVSQNPGNVTDTKAEEADPVSKQQKMDRAYLEGIMAEPTEEPAGDEVTNLDTGEITRMREEAPADVPAEELSWTAPVEEFMQRAGLTRDYPGVVITNPESHEQVEKLANDANDAVQLLTNRIDGMQMLLGSEIGDSEFRAAVEAEKRRFIDERNRIKDRMRAYGHQLSDSEYIGEKSINNIVRHCLETGDVDWETPIIRSKKIDEIRTREIDGIRKRMAERMKGRQDTALSIDDVAYILETGEMRQTLTRRNQVAWALRSQIRQLSEAIEDAEEGAKRIREENETDGETTDRMTRLARLDEYLFTARTQLENGQKAMRMYFDSGSNLSMKDILSGKSGGRLPLPVMNRLFAILQQEEISRKRSTNRIGFLNNINNPLRTVEFFTGEFAPIFNALYVDSALQKNASMAKEMDEITSMLKGVDIPKKYEEVAFLYAEGKVSDDQLEERVSDSLDRTKIRLGVEVYKQLYARLLSEVNETLVRNGFDPVKERSHYVHHMREAQDLIGKVCSKFGIHISDDVLPTSFAGKTEELKPRRKFASFALERKGDETSYKLLRNTMSYVESALRVIHHTDNISRLRQLEGVSLETQNKAPVYSGIRQYGELVRHDEKAADRPKEAYSSFAEWISRYADGLAGKKSGKLDRAVEGNFGRNFLQLISGLKRLNGSSFAAYSPKVAASNILPVGVSAVVSPSKTMAALLDTHKAFRDHEVANFESGSAFLTSRFSGKGMSDAWLDNFLEKGYVMSEAVDRFASHVVVRTFYKVGREKGWGHTEAMKWADQMAWRMMGSRKTGEGSNTMNSTVSSTLLQFSNESINNLMFLMHDLPRYHGGDKKKTALSLFWLMIVNFLYNGLLSTDTAPEVITPTIRSAREWDDEKTFVQNSQNVIGNYAEALNPTNLGTGGSYGKGFFESIPLVSSAIDVVTADNADDFLTACLDFVPGSATANRTLTAAGDLIRGYSVDSDGNIKYVLSTDEFSAGTVFDVIASAILGSNSSIGGRKYKANGSDTLSPSETAAFHTQKELGKSNQEAYGAVTGYTAGRTNANASNMKMPKWATEVAQTDWMKAVQEAGPDAYPSMTPDSISGYTLTDEDKTAFEKLYKAVYKSHINTAIEEETSLVKAASDAYSLAKKRFTERMEG